MGAWVYIMADRKHGVIYVGVTSDLIKRVVQHKDGTFKGFTHKYSVHRVVYFEQHATMPLAIQREKNIKHWPRAWKVRLIHEGNPEWVDLYDSLIG